MFVVTALLMARSKYATSSGVICGSSIGPS